MDSSREHFESQQPAPGGFTDIRALKDNSTAAVAELREFLGELQGRSPQEVIGIVSQTGLFRGITAATVGTLVVLVVFTIGPYALYGGPSSGPDAESGELAAASDDEPAPDDSPDVQSAAETNADTNSAKPDLERAADAMGISEATDANPNENPLDSKLDKLLDGID